MFQTENLQVRPPKSEKEQYTLGLMFDPKKHVYVLKGGQRLVILIPTLEDENDIVTFGEMDINYIHQRNTPGFKAVAELLLFGKRDYPEN